MVFEDGELQFDYSIDQYDQLGGHSEFSDQGTLPVQSVIGSLDGGAANGGYSYKQIQGGATSPLSEYLPPKEHRY